MNQSNRYGRFLASYIDFAIFVNLVSVANILCGLAIAREDVKLLIYIVLYAIIGMFYLFKDTVFENASIGKYLVGLKLESTSKKTKSSLTPNLCLRNLFSCIALALYMLYSLTSNKPLEGYIILLTFVVINFLFFCFKPNKKLGDYLARLQVVEDADNKMWKNIDTEKKNGCVAVVTFLLSLPLIDLVAQIVLTMIRIWYYEYGLMILKGSLIIGFYVLMFYFYYKLAAKFADNVLLKRLIIVGAAVSVLALLSVKMLQFVVTCPF